ncbi:hypothetical protein O3P69_005896 [Scylla paramamosain]|uniref:Uncharacterized protein n=1 Tax=Scylla paramamosain TaxID=85552 RepID=A0AAW0U4L9_SCYPA
MSQCGRGGGAGGFSQWYCPASWEHCIWCCSARETRLPVRRGSTEAGSPRSRGQEPASLVLFLPPLL